jgi:hypothetical protein
VCLFRYPRAYPRRRINSITHPTAILLLLCLHIPHIPQVTLAISFRLIMLLLPLLYHLLRHHLRTIPCILSAASPPLRRLWDINTHHLFYLNRYYHHCRTLDHHHYHRLRRQYREAVAASGRRDGMLTRLYLRSPCSRGYRSLNNLRDTTMPRCRRV